MDKNAAAQSIRRLAVQYQGMVEAADALEQIGSLEQHEAEVRARLAVAQAAETNARHTLETIEQASRDADAEQKATREQTMHEHDATVDAAVVQANDILGAARARAQEIVTAATAESEKLHELTIREQTAAGQRLEQLVREETEALARKSAAEAEAVTAQAKLDAIRKQIADIANA